MRGSPWCLASAAAARAIGSQQHWCRVHRSAETVLHRTGHRSPSPWCSSRRLANSLAHPSSFMSLVTDGGDAATKLVWRDDLSTGNGHRGEVSVLSWNILSETASTSAASEETYAYRGIKLRPPREWKHRRPQILDAVVSSDADVACLQEVDSAQFEEDILPALEKLGGYDGLLQEGKGPHPAVATFWKKRRFHLVASCQRSRTMAIVLEDRDASQTEDEINNIESSPLFLAIVNCHLEGHPLSRRNSLSYG